MGRERDGNEMGSAGEVVEWVGGVGGGKGWLERVWGKGGENDWMVRAHMGKRDGKEIRKV
jgi:hypothetical protein